MLLEKFRRFVILIRDLGTRGTHRACTGQTALVDESFGLPRVGLVLNSVVVPRDYSVQRTRLFRVVRPRTETGADRYLVFSGDARVESIQGVNKSAGCEITSVHRA